MAHPFSGSWGYQVTGYFAPTPPLRHAGRSARFVDPCTQRGHRRDPRLGAGALPARRLRRSRASTARALYEHADPRQGAHPDWGTLDLQLRPPRGAQLPDRQRAVLAARVPRRRPARRRRRLDALPRLLAPARASGCPTSSAAARTSRRSPSSRSSTRCSTPTSPGACSAAEESTAWPGVSRPTYLGGLGFGFKWNMGWMHDTLGYFQQDPVHRRYHHHELTFSLHLRLQRELHPAALPRRGRARQGLAARQDAGRPLAAARQPARAVRLHVGPPGQEAAVHGLRVRPGARVEPRALARLAPARAARARGRPVAGARPQPPVPRASPRCGSSTPTRRASGGWSPTTPTTT